MEWKDVTECFSESQRHYKDTYLEQDEVYDDELELSIFSSEVSDYEIYFNYGRFYGIVYAKAEDAYSVRDNIKKELEEAYKKEKEPSSEFINQFSAKYNVQLPMDIYFDFDLEKAAAQLDELFNMKDKYDFF